MPLNPNRARSFVDSYENMSEIQQVRNYPFFFNQVKINNFRHLQNVELNFRHPITVISGSNKNGKTSILMTIACSHFNFDRQDVVSGEWRRATWSEVVRFTDHDSQTSDWSYSIKFRTGENISTLSGRRNHRTKKWSGVAKKENQIGHPRFDGDTSGRHVCLLDVNRINPARHLSKTVYRKAKVASRSAILESSSIKEYLSYILEASYDDIESLTAQGDSTIYCLSPGAGQRYSSFNTASGEDVLINLIEQIMHMPEKSLILIDEIEIGLHPKIQHRLMDVLYIISQRRHLQFIIVSHSYAVIDSVPAVSRIFLDRNGGVITANPGLSTYETLTRMDSHIFPCADLFVEDDISHWIIDKAINEINAANPGFACLIKIYEIGAADKTYNCFQQQLDLRGMGQNGAKPLCILDGDMREIKDSSGNFRYPTQADLFFHFSDLAPEKMLLEKYLECNPNESLQYHLDNSNPHCLLEKIVESGLVSSRKEAFNLVFESYKTSPDGAVHYDELKTFLKNAAKDVTN